MSTARSYLIHRSRTLSVRPRRRLRSVDQDLATIEEALVNSRAPIGSLSPPQTSGVYAFFLTDITALVPFVPGREGLLYVGTSGDLATREFDNHFNSTGTGFSTLRRSLGAILKEQLRLTAIRRGPGPSSSNVTNYRFAFDGEERLTRWMQNALVVGICPIAEAEPTERQLIQRLQPPLNLQGWRNPNAAAIRELRRTCAKEAREGS